MPKRSKTLIERAARLLALCIVAGPAAAMPSEDHAGDHLAREGYPERFVRIAAFDWSKAVPDPFIQANLTIESALPFPLQQVEVACAQFARTGIEIDSRRRTIAGVVPAHGRLRVQALDLGPVHPQASSSGCRIVRVTPA